MRRLSEILGRRRTPGVLILDLNNAVQYCNGEALRMIPSLKEILRGKEQEIPPEIADLCDRLKAHQEGGAGGDPKDSQCSALIGICQPAHSVRAFFVGKDLDTKGTHIMVLVEKITEKRDIDFERAGTRFQLTARETEVLELLCDGLSNRKISERLFISEQTVKDHVKHIFRKMKVASRSQIITTLK